jgi:tripartite-type tricarboxylate transporter receptor subunit TctC
MAMKKSVIQSCIFLAGVVGSAFPALVHADDAYPSKTITLVVPFPPGGVADTVARPVAQAMSRELKQTIIVENKGGAGGAIGTGYAAKSQPDGYTLLMSLSNLTTIPEADKITGRTPLFQMAQLKPIARFTADPTVLVVRADSPWKTAREFIEAARAKPGAYSFSSSGNYGTMHVPMEMLKANANVRILHVPYTGAGPAVMGLLSGQVDSISTGPASVVQHIKAGKLRALAHWGTTPLAALPEVPSLKQLGYNVEYAQWSGLFVPASTPDEIVAKLRAAARKAAEDPAVRQTISSAGSPILYMDTPEFTSYVANDAKRMKDIVQKIGKVE